MYYSILVFTNQNLFLGYNQNQLMMTKLPTREHAAQWAPG